MAPRKKTGEIDYQAVSRRAYELWEERGRPNGGHDDDWYRAEQELRTAPKTLNGNGEPKKPATRKPKATTARTSSKKS
jgi:hypothetical protein